MEASEWVHRWRWLMSVSNYLPGSRVTLTRRLRLWQRVIWNMIRMLIAIIMSITVVTAGMITVLSITVMEIESEASLYQGREEVHLTQCSIITISPAARSCSTAR